MIEMLMNTFSSLQSAYQTGEAVYNAGPDILNGLFAGMAFVLGAVFVKVTFFGGKR